MKEKLKEWLVDIKARVPARPLFIKFFVCFVVLAWCSIHAVQLRTYLMGPQVIPPPDLYAVVAPIMAAEAVRVYESGGPDAFKRFATQQEDPTRQIYLLDQVNHDVLSRSISSEGLKAAVAARTGQVMIMRGRVAVYKYVTTSGRPYVLMLYLDNGSGLLREMSVGSKEGTFRLSMLIAVTLSCAWLAYQISTPVRRIQIAARRVAEGDLTTRIPASVLKRRDELAALGRDFDSMVARLEVLVRNQKNLLDSVSHELRSPLARINLTLSILRRRSLDTDVDLMNQLERDVERVDVLIGQLLMLSRLENGVSSGEQTSVNLTQLLEEVVADGSFEAQAVSKDVRLIASWSPTLRDANALALRSAFENIVRNAIRFTRPNTEVRVALEAADTRAGRCAKISITDVGPGLPEEFKEEIFQPFFRVPGREKSGTGNGLGLAIAHEAIRLHHGTIVARNVNPEGLKIVIHLPIDSAIHDKSKSKETVQESPHSSELQV